MCLSIPGKIIEIDGEMAKVSVGGSVVNTALHLVEDVKVGDYVLVHTGFALQKISEEEAIETLRLIRELEDQTDNTGI
jgi:hydrogenase expression/formation protein HypC